MITVGEQIVLHHFRMIDEPSLLRLKSYGLSNAPSLARPHAELRGAFLLDDTLVVTLYQLGNRQQVRTPESNWEEQFSLSKQQQTAPNAFVRHVYTGQIVSQFRYNGYYE